MRSRRPSALGVAYSAIAVFTVLGTTAGMTYTEEEPATSTAAALSADGTKVAFVSWYDGLVPGDNNSTSDVFVRDLVTGTVVRASTTARGEQTSPPAGTGEARYRHRGFEAPVLSADGSRVAFLSDSPGLVPGDTNREVDVFVKDLTTGAVTRASTAADGAQAHGADNYTDDEREPAPRHCEETADDESGRRLAVSADGWTVAFLSRARDLVPGDTNGCPDAFVKDLRTGAVTRVSTTATGTQVMLGAADYSIALSADGSTVAFTSAAENLVPGPRMEWNSLFVRNLRTGVLTRTIPKTGSAYEPSLSADGTKVAFRSSTTAFGVYESYERADASVEDLRTRKVTRVSVTARGAEFEHGVSDPLLSPDGTTVTFSSESKGTPEDTDSVRDVFRKDLRTGTVTRVSTSVDGTGLTTPSYVSSVSIGARTVAFSMGDNMYVREASRLLRLTPHPDERPPLVLRVLRQIF